MPEFEREKIVHALDRVATVIGKKSNTLENMRREFMPKNNMKQILPNLRVFYLISSPFLLSEIRFIKFVVMLFTPGSRDFGLI
jgi:hypothetical protein